WIGFWFDDQNNVEQVEGSWKDKSLVFLVPPAGEAEQLSLWITPQKESDDTWTLAIDVCVDGTAQPRFRARMTRE
ncbi:MAG: hypothetical protein V3U28_03320, partial [Candidatus Acidoferrales bacterium]